MINTTYSTLRPLSMTTPSGEDNPLPRLPNYVPPGGSTGGINPNNMYNLGGMRTGGNLSPNLTNILQNMSTGGALPPTTKPAVPEYQTGGNLPPMPVYDPGPRHTTGGVLPPTEVGTGQHPMDPVYTGGNLPPTGARHAPPLPNETGGPRQGPGPVQTGGNLPPTQVPNDPNAPMNATTVAQLISQMWQQMGGGTYNPSYSGNPADMANQFMNTITGSNSPYIQQARRQALAQANSRGLLNGSIAAGNAQGAAIDAAMPMFQQAYGLQGQREGQDFQGHQADLDRAMTRLGMGQQLYGQDRQNAFTAGQSALDRELQKYGIDTNLLNEREGRDFTGQQNALDRSLKDKLQSDAAFQQDWLNSNSFTRQFNAALSMIPINSADQLTQMIAQFGAQDPETFTPQVMSGMINFLTQNMSAIIDKYFNLPAGGP